MDYTTATPSQNKDALDYFVQLPVSREMISYLAKKANQVIRCDQVPHNASALPTPPGTPPQDAAELALPSVEAFIASLVERSHVQVPTLMTSLVYLARLKSRLPAVAKGMRCTVHRIFLATLILAAKNLNDSSPKNKHWARYTSVRGFPNFGFSITEVNLMEKQLLFLLDWDLRVRPEDLYCHFDPFLTPIRDHQVVEEQIRMRELQQKEAYAQQYRTPTYSCYAVDNYSTHSRTYSQTSSIPSSRGASRTPSLSPPSRSSTSSSSPDTESLPDMYESTDELCAHGVESQDGSILVHIQAPEQYSSKAPLSWLQSHEEKPAKKARMGTSGGNFFSRLLNSTSSRAGAY